MVMQLHLNANIGPSRGPHNMQVHPGVIYVHFIDGPQCAGIESALYAGKIANQSDYVEGVYDTLRRDSWLLLL